MLKGIKLSTLPIVGKNNPGTLPIKGAVQVSIENKGNSSVTILDDIVIEAGDTKCLPAIDGFFYCQDISVQFSSNAVSEKLLLTKWIPVEDECC